MYVLCILILTAVAHLVLVQQNGVSYLIKIVSYRFQMCFLNLSMPWASSCYDIAVTLLSVGLAFVQGWSPKVTYTNYANYVLLHRPHMTGLGGGVGCIVNESYLRKSIESPIFPTFQHMIVSLNVRGSRLLVMCVYRPPGSCSNDFLDNFLSLIGFLSSAAVYTK